MRDINKKIINFVYRKMLRLFLRSNRRPSVHHHQLLREKLNLESSKKLYNLTIDQLMSKPRMS